LTTSYSIIVRHEGYITLHSEESKGTLIDVYLPASEKKLHEEIPGLDVIFHGTGKILLMDDDDLIRDVTGKMIHELGYIIETARNGEEAVDLYKAALKDGTPFNLMIMDLTVPGGMGGVEALQRIRTIDPQARAIVSSGYSSDLVLSQFDKYGFSGCLIKPYKVEKLSNVIKTVMSL
jgi:two-component system, cell cycle sensor histidine kinase and response regulator CckA